MTTLHEVSTLITPWPAKAETRAAAQTRAPVRVGHYLALTGVLLVAVFFHFYQLDRVGYGNLYYAAAVKSMSQNFFAFFFTSFDTAGYVTVDKPPLGLWGQVLSVWIFGEGGLSLMLPQAIAGVLSVVALYILVRREFGPEAGLIAALVLAVTPVSIAANRNNTMDSQLVFTSLLATLAVSLAAERGQLRWLLLSAFLVGVGFNIKMLQAYMILPAVYLTYLLGRGLWWKRLAHLVLATFVLLVVSLAWVVIVDLTPPDQRPFIGSSTDNTMLELVIGHNGLARLGGGLRGVLALGGSEPNKVPLQNPSPNQNGLPPRVPNQPQPPQPPQPPQGVQGPQNETGPEGWARLFNQQLAGQATWLLPLALGCLVILLLRWPLTTQHRAALMWGAWLIPQVIFFSYAGLFHRYYLEMLSPAIAALVGAGLALLWDEFRQRRWRGGLLPVALIVGVATQGFILSRYTEQSQWLTPLIGGLTLVAVLGLILMQFKRIDLVARSLIVIGVVTLNLAPAVWASTTFGGGDSGLPFAGPELGNRRPNVPNVTMLANYLQANHGSAKFLAATLNANTAAPLILETGEAVMAMGGFSGRDNIMNAAELAERVQQKEVRFFLVPRQSGDELGQWVNRNCQLLDQRVWQSPSPGLALGGRPGGAVDLFDCEK